MIGYLNGKIISVEQSGAMSLALVDVGGVGYEVHLPSRSSHGMRVGQPCSLHIYTHMRADGRGDAAIELYGFNSAWEKKVFLVLTSVSGVGFRTALGILGTVEPMVILQSIVRQDRARLQAAPGIGKKTAERIILELADKASKLLTERPREVGIELAGRGASEVTEPMNTTQVRTLSATAGAASVAFEADSDFWLEAQQALVALGFREADAAQALRETYRDSAGKDLSVQSFVRGALLRLRGV